MRKPRKFLTKSIFKIGLQCPRKLFYLNKQDEYLNNNVADPFLEALARGGFQVGALATLKYPTGIEVKSKDHEEALKVTAELLKLENVIIFEAAFSIDSLFVRADIVIKSGSKVRLIEVKSKSFDPSDIEAEFLSSRATKAGQTKVLSEWVHYLYDLAFQTHVARANYPALSISANFMGVDKTSTCPEDGVHQLFLVKQKGKSKEVILTKAPPQNFNGHNILREVELTFIVDQIIAGTETSELPVFGTMAERSQKLSDIYLKNERFPAKLATGSRCKNCEFRGEDKELKSGFDECWVEQTNIAAASSKKLVFDLWNFRGAQKALDKKKYLMEELELEDLGKGITVARQLVQLDLYRTKKAIPWFNLPGLTEAMSEWTYPLHFIDFETCTPAIPFKKGFAPFAEIAFQFSHHVMHADGRVEHFGEFIDLRLGSYPTFNFMRELKRQLENDRGTILRYSSHENSVINRAIFQLQQSNEPDKEALIAFFKTITTKKASDKKDDFLWNGDRKMVDLLELVKSFYLSPLMGSSNSLKYVLPAILNESTWLQERYSKPIYGTTELPSLNFKNHSWIKYCDGKYSSNPYQELEPLFAPEDLVRIEQFMSDEDEAIKNGGAAMMAYCKSQFTAMPDVERDLLRKALLKYCELDTLAMVMLVEYWRDVCRIARKVA